jgi:hypothetical protein
VIGARIIVPKGGLVDIGAMRRNLSGAYTAAAKGAQVDFEVTQQTWEHKAQFKTEGNQHSRRVFTTNAIYGYVDKGTPAHDIRPRNGKVLVFGVGGRAKTRPGVIGSSKGSKGGQQIITPKAVRHPGTEARDFSGTIQAKWQKQFPLIVQNAISKAVG